LSNSQGSSVELELREWVREKISCFLLCIKKRCKYQSRG
jgi:hypothetical protein